MHLTYVIFGLGKIIDEIFKAHDHFVEVDILEEH